jgi:cytosol alanyl aminopeptidase
VIPVLRRAPALLLALVGSAVALAASAGAESTVKVTGTASRLATDVVPVFEAIRLVADARKPDYSGTVRIELDVRKPAAGFSLHAKEMEIRRLALTGPTGAAVDATHAKAERGRLDVTASAPLRPGRHVLEIDFANEYDTRATGLYKVVVKGESYLFTQLEADDARQAFPCWDEPAFKIPYQMTVVVPEAHVAVSNTPPTSDTVEGGQRTVVFARTKPLPSYLLALATGPLDFVPIPGMSIPGRVVTVKGESALAAYAVQTTPPVLAALERYFGRPYPYEKLDLIAVPEFWPGAMENAGAVTFRDSILLLDARGASAQQRRQLVEVNAHELAHMWFGDLVTMEWWDDLWLNESFASWMGNKAAAEAFPEFRTSVASVQGAQHAMNTDARLTARAIRQPVTSLDNLLQSADELAYEKGQAVLGMVESWVGPDAFRRGVLDYLAAHEWRNAVAADLWNALSKAAGKDVAGTLTTFLDQPGVPLVTVESVDGRRVRLSQRRFANQGVTLPAASWRIPVGLKYETGGQVKTQVVLLAGPSNTVTLEGAPDWVHPNADETGYYRWSVPSAMRRAIAENGPRALTVRERLGFLGNASALLDAGALRGHEYLELLVPFARDTEPEVVSGVVGALQKVKRAFVTPETEPAFAGYVRRVLGPALERLGMERRPDEPESSSLLRPQLLLWIGRDGRDPAVLAHAAKVTTAYLADPASVDPSIVGVSLRLRALSGDRALFDEFRRRMEAATVPADRGHFLAALGYFRGPELVEEALRFAVAGTLRPQEIFEIPEGVASAVAYEDRPYRFMTEHYETIKAKLPPMFLVFLPHAAGGCSEERAQSAKAFFADPAHASPGVEKEMAKVAEATRDCAALRSREGAAVTAYLGRP